MVCSGAYPDAPRCPMLSTVESVVAALSGAAPAVGAQRRAVRTNRANARTTVNLDRYTSLYLPSDLPLQLLRRLLLRPGVTLLPLPWRPHDPLHGSRTTMRTQANPATPAN